VACGLLGTLEWPVVGTFVGVLVGLVVGSAVGLANGASLAILTAATTSRWMARIVVAVTSLACAAIPAYLTGASLRWDWAGPLVLGIGLAGAVGPFAAFGVQPVVLHRRLRRWPVRVLVRRIVASGAIAGAGLGGVAGLVIGVVAYLPTAPFAVVEGAVLGSVSGVLLAGLVAAALVAPELRVRR
jgi:outer membrane lipoprotein SlyB